MGVPIPKDAVNIDKVINWFYLIIFLGREGGKISFQWQFCNCIIAYNELAPFWESTILPHKIVVWTQRFVFCSVEFDTGNLFCLRASLFLPWYCHISICKLGSLNAIPSLPIYVYGEISLVQPVILWFSQNSNLSRFNRRLRCYNIVSILIDCWRLLGINCQSV